MNVIGEQVGNRIVWKQTSSMGRMLRLSGAPSGPPTKGNTRGYATRDLLKITSGSANAGRTEYGDMAFFSPSKFKIGSETYPTTWTVILRKQTRTRTRLLAWLAWSGWSGWDWSVREYSLAAGEFKSLENGEGVWEGEEGANHIQRETNVDIWITLVGVGKSPSELAQEQLNAVLNDPNATKEQKDLARRQYQTMIDQERARGSQWSLQWSEDTKQMITNIALPIGIIAGIGIIGYILWKRGTIRRLATPPTVQTQAEE